MPLSIIIQTMLRLAPQIVVVFAAWAPSLLSAAEYRLPFEDQWFVMAGGDTINVNHHMRERSQWFGIDFMKTGGPNNRAVTRGKPQSVRDFYSWGARVLSPVAGVVRQVENGQIDQPLGESDRDNAFGNFVMIEASPREYVFLAHFQRGSIVVQVGDQVQPGRLLGKCGNSGNTSGPHIHMHVQDHPEPYTGRGRNITFSGVDVLLSGKRFENVDWPLIQGLFVSPAVER